MSTLKSLALGLALLALLGQLDSQAQKTPKSSFQQTLQAGSGPQSVYGGYQQGPGQRRPSLAAPVQQRRTELAQVSRQSSSSGPAPVYQQEESASGSSSYEQAEAAAEPASYGKWSLKWPPHRPRAAQTLTRPARPPTTGAVSGQPGRDFPAYSQVPKTSFSCEGLPYEYGMYADEETGCQAYHVCYNGRKDSFLCGVGTVFNQRILHCDYWYSVDCAKSSQYYSSNAYMGSSQPEPGPAPSSSAASSYQPSASAVRPSAVQRSKSSFSQNTQQLQEAY